VQLIRNVMDKAVASKLNVMRAFATTVDANYPLATSPGVYNENMFRGLDYALDQARQRGIKVPPPPPPPLSHCPPQQVLYIENTLAGLE